MGKCLFFCFSFSASLFRSCTRPGQHARHRHGACPQHDAAAERSPRAWQGQPGRGSEGADTKSFFSEGSWSNDWTCRGWRLRARGMRGVRGRI